MDDLSLRKVPYFFMIDFLASQVEVFQENELEAAGVLVDFGNSFSNTGKEIPSLGQRAGMENLS
ncbi:hypothetical protein [Chryseobacterium sp. SORGH_AS_0909]|uniref:hypothetical protein n=1 Tax=Chryseobacterium sp. SORGH_AS_0909 TaxID=3041759 RepID=UPI0038D37D43